MAKRGTTPPPSVHVHKLHKCGTILTVFFSLSTNRGYVNIGTCPFFNLFFGGRFFLHQLLLIKMWLTQFQCLHQLRSVIKLLEQRCYFFCFFLTVLLSLKGQHSVSGPPRFPSPPWPVGASCFRTRGGEHIHMTSHTAPTVSLHPSRPPHPCRVSQVVPLHVKTASVYCGRIVRQDDVAFREMAAKMKAYYSDNKPVAKELVEGRLYGLVLEEEVHRWGAADYTERNWPSEQDWGLN